MILTEVFGKVESIDDLDSYHVETATVRSDDLTKRILRVTSDHDREYGIRLNADSDPLENGSAFDLGGHHLLVLTALPDEVLVVHPRGIDEMGVLAHFVGNMHKPVQIQDGTITLLYDPVVEQALKDKAVIFDVVKSQLNEPLRYVDMTGYGAAHDAAHAAMGGGHHHHHHQYGHSPKPDEESERHHHGPGHHHHSIHAAPHHHDGEDSPSAPHPEVHNG